MTREEFRSLVDSKIVILDGATGSNLIKRGMPSGVCPEKWILDNPEVLIKLQEEFIEAGSDILYAPTFSGNSVKLKEYGLENEMEEFNHRLVALSREAVNRTKEKMALAGRKVYVAGDITMTGEQLKPMGKLEFEELVDIYKAQIKALCAAGCDLLVVETMMSLQESRAALIAAKETCDLPVMVTLSFNEDGRTLYGTDAKTAIIVLQSLGADAVGVNCSTGPDKMYTVLKEMAGYAYIPLIAKPNAGLPKLEDGITVYDMDAQEFEEKSKLLLDAGVSIVGGCCGTTPEHLAGLARTASGYKPVNIKTDHIRALTTERKTLEIELDGRFIVVGERINPTGKKALQAELREGKLDIVEKMAEEQEEAGADILDINMGMNGIDEKEMMLKVVDEVLMISSLPLCIDSSHVDVIEAALRIYPGRALINSISLEKEKFEKLIPIAKKYGAMFVLLPLSDEGLPKNIDEKKRIIDTIVNAAFRAGMTKEDIIVDGLVNTVGANKLAAIETMETIRYCKEQGIATICGLSNISFGLPERVFVNSTFLAFAIQTGLTMAIANPSQDLLMNIAFAADMLKNVEEADVRYIERVTSRPVAVMSAAEKEKLIASAAAGGTEGNVPQGSADIKVPAGSTATDASLKDKEAAPVFTAVLKGNKKKIAELIKEELDKGMAPQAILNDMLIAGINEVGVLFEKKKYFLPQLIASAEAMKTGIEYLEPVLNEGEDRASEGTVVIATVSGDIHDIGKNLVTLMLKNYGFKVIDLGKDVDSELIIQTAKEQDADIIALSALMTTTMMEMKNVVDLRNKAGLRAKIMIGGAVITQSYCDEIGADGYSDDAREAVEVARKLVREGRNA